LKYALVGHATFTPSPTLRGVIEKKITEGKWENKNYYRG
jgi:hypothetical protein